MVCLGSVICKLDFLPSFPTATIHECQLLLLFRVFILSSSTLRMNSHYRRLSPSELASFLLTLPSLSRR